MKSAITDIETKTRAMELYLAGGLKHQEIADKLSINVSVLRSWINEGNWSAARKKLEVDALANCEAKVREFIQTNRLDTLKRHLAAAKGIEDRIIQKLTGINPATGKAFYLTEKDIATLAQALKSSADVSARAAGINDSTMGGGQKGNNMLVLIGAQPRKIAHAPKPVTPISISEPVLGASEPF